MPPNDASDLRRLARNPLLAQRQRGSQQRSPNARFACPCRLPDSSVIATVGNSALSPIRPGEADSHAFDTLTKPYNFGGDSPATGALQQLRRAADSQGVALAARIILTVAGAIVRIRAPRESAVPGGSNPTADSPHYSQFGVRAALWGATSVCLAASVYGYFPPPEELGDRLRLESGNLFDAVGAARPSRGM